jgi:hypothetical protein
VLDRVLQLKHWVIGATVAPFVLASVKGIRRR